MSAIDRSVSHNNFFARSTRSSVMAVRSDAHGLFERAREVRVANLDQSSDRSQCDSLLVVEVFIDSLERLRVVFEEPFLSPITRPRPGPKAHADRALQGSRTHH